MEWDGSSPARCEKVYELGWWAGWWVGTGIGTWDCILGVLQTLRLSATLAFVTACLVLAWLDWIDWICILHSLGLLACISCLGFGLGFGLVWVG